MEEPRTNTNLFSYKDYCKEDFISISLAYVSNLFPREIGDRWLRRIEAKADLKRGSLGIYKTCEFVGHSFIQENAKSKPDLVLYSSKSTIVVEVKVNSPLNRKQMSRHLKTAPLFGRGTKVIFLSNTLHNLPELKNSSQFLRPSNGDHFVWADFESCFAPKFRKGSIGARLVNDLRTAMRTNGLLGRSIPEAKGSIYTPGSPANRFAIDSLHKILKINKFTSIRSRRENTIRVYPVGQKGGLLLNPRFESTGEAWNEAFNNECLLIHVWGEKGFNDGQSVMKKLIRGTAFCFEENEQGGWLLGALYLPLLMWGRSIDFKYLEKSFVVFKKNVESLQRG